MKKTSRSKGSIPIKQNRPTWRKKVIGFTKSENRFFHDIKIKGKDYEKVKK